MISKQLKNFIENESNETNFDFKYAEGLLQYLEDKFNPNKECFGSTFDYFEQNLHHFSERELTFYLLCKNYSITRGAFFLAYYAESELPKEGWKIHISLNDWSEYLYCIQVILPELVHLELFHKVVSPFKFEELCDREQHDVQCGKHLVIYPESLEFISKISPTIHKFLLEKADFPVVTDKCLGGRVFARYTGFSHDTVIHPQTKEYIYIPREEGLYKPDWIEEPPSLQELL